MVLVYSHCTMALPHFGFEREGSKHMADVKIKKAVIFTQWGRSSESPIASCCYHSNLG